MANLNNVVDSLTTQLQNTSIPQKMGISFAGKGLKLDKAQDAKPIVDEINSSDMVEFLNMEGNSLGVDAAQEIAKALENRKEFKKALWKDMFTSRLKTEIPVALKHLTGSLMLAGARIEILDLSDNASGPIGVEGFEEFLRSPSCYSLRELRLNNMGLGVTGAKKLASALHELYNNSKNAGQPLKLEVFVAGRNRLENPGATALAQVFQKIGTLKEVSMPQNGIYHVGINALSSAFDENLSLEVINLNDNTITEKGAKSLSEVLSKLSNLKTLDLGDCLLKSQGATLIAQSISSLKKLEYVNLSFNEVKSSAGSLILDALSPLAQSLSSLDMNGNQFGASLTELLSSRAKKLNLPLASLSEDEGDDSEHDVEEADDDEEEEEEDIDDEEEDYQEDSESDQPYNIDTQTDDTDKKEKVVEVIQSDVNLVTSLLESICLHNTVVVAEENLSRSIEVNDSAPNVPSECTVTGNHSSFEKSVQDKDNSQCSLFDKEISSPKNVAHMSPGLMKKHDNVLDMSPTTCENSSSVIVTEMFTSSEMKMECNKMVETPSPENKSSVPPSENLVKEFSPENLTCENLLINFSSPKNIGPEALIAPLARENSLKLIPDNDLLASSLSRNDMEDVQFVSCVETTEAVQNSCSEGLDLYTFVKTAPIENDKQLGSLELDPQIKLFPQNEINQTVSESKQLSNEDITRSEGHDSTPNLSECLDKNGPIQKDLISIDSESSYQDPENEGSSESLNKFISQLKNIPAPESDVGDDQVENNTMSSIGKSSTSGSFDLDRAKSCIIF